jgi:ATP-binding cassette, subfamily C, bacterial CydCD
MAQPRHPSRTLLRVLGGGARGALAVAAVGAFLERLALVGATFEAVGDRAVSALVFAAGLGVIFFVRSAARAYLRAEVRGRVIGAVSSALLGDDVGPGAKNVDEVETGLLDGLYASEVLIGEHLPDLLGCLPACACMVAIASTLLPIRIVLEGSVALGVGAVALLFARRASSRNTQRVWRAFEPLLEDLSIAVRGGVEIVASGDAESFLSSLRHKTERWRALSARASLLSFLAGRAPVVAVAFAAGLVLVLDEGLRGPVFHGVLGRAVVLASMTPAFAGLARSWFEMGKSDVRADAIAALVERAQHSRAHGETPPAWPVAIGLEHIHFGYGSGQPEVLCDLTATFRPGEVVVVSGPNGSGKSTLLALLLGLAKPTRGTISIGATDLASLDCRVFRRQVAYLPQRPFLPDRSTAGEAMRLLAPDAEDAVLEQSLRRVKLWSVLSERAPRRPLDARVSSLSAGERQRLALARVLARRAPIMLLDEPDANLDAEGLELLVALSAELAPGRCIVIAAHSPRLVASADRIVSLAGDGGAIRSRVRESPAEAERTA